MSLLLENPAEDEGPKAEAEDEGPKTEAEEEEVPKTELLDPAIIELPPNAGGTLG